MSEKSYPGIDYSLGQANRDTKTGIHYGVIPLHALNAWAFESFEDDYGPPTCGHCGNEVADYDDEKHGDYKQTKHGCDDYACEDCERTYDSGECYPEEPVATTLDDGDYQAFIDSSNDVWVIRSPYYTHAQYCSPCAPGAGHLGNPCSEGPRTYCFGHDWFEDEIAPYPVYSVKDAPVLPEEKTQPEQS